MLRSLTGLLTRKNLKNLSIKCPQLTLTKPITSDCVLNRLKRDEHRHYGTSEPASRTTFLQVENAFAHAALKPLSAPRDGTVTAAATRTEVRTRDDFERRLAGDWRRRAAPEIVAAFGDALGYCKKNGISVSDRRFDALVDGLMDNVERLDAGAIASLLRFLVESPPPDGSTAHNYHDMWSALDDACCWRLRDWDLQTALQIAELWYKLGLGRLCDFIYDLLDKYSKKPERLSKTELVYMFFYFNVCRKRKMDFSYEDAVERKIHLMSPDEAAIVAMGLFKTKTKVKSAKTLQAMIDCAINNSKTIHEISLTAILKVVRVSQNPHIAERTAELLRHFAPEVGRLSNLCCLHIGLTGTGSQIFVPGTLTAIAEKISRQIGDVRAVRLKDIERLLLALTMFDFEPEVSRGRIYDLLLGELYNAERRPEMELYPRCVPCALQFLALRDVYPEDLIDGVLNVGFLRDVYGRGPGDLPRELFTLDLNVEIDRPAYAGRRIPAELRRRCGKLFVERLPNRGKRSMAAADKLIYDVLDTCSNIVGDSSNVFLGHILPHYTKADIVLCYDKAEKRFVPPQFEQYRIGDIVYPPDVERYKWFVVMPIPVNSMIRFIREPVGLMRKKWRQLKRVGYEPVPVPYHEYLPLDPDGKLGYIRSKINEQT